MVDVHVSIFKLSASVLHTQDLKKLCLYYWNMPPPSLPPAVFYRLAGQTSQRALYK